MPKAKTINISALINHTSARQLPWVEHFNDIMPVPSKKGSELKLPDEVWLKKIILDRIFMKTGHYVNFDTVKYSFM